MNGIRATVVLALVYLTVITGCGGRSFDDYSSGWERGCDLAFQSSPTGALYDDGQRFTTSDCPRPRPNDYMGATDAYDQGVSDGCFAVFDELSRDGKHLYYGGRSLSPYDNALVCP